MYADAVHKILPKQSSKHTHTQSQPSTCWTWAQRRALNTKSTPPSLLLLPSPSSFPSMLRDTRWANNTRQQFMSSGHGCVRAYMYIFVIPVILHFFLAAHEIPIAIAMLRYDGYGKINDSASLLRFHWRALFAWMCVRAYIFFSNLLCTIYYAELLLLLLLMRIQNGRRRRRAK